MYFTSTLLVRSSLSDSQTRRAHYPFLFSECGLDQPKIQIIKIRFSNYKAPSEKSTNEQIVAHSLEVVS